MVVAVKVVETVEAVVVVEVEAKDMYTTSAQITSDYLSLHALVAEPNHNRYHIRAAAVVEVAADTTATADDDANKDDGGS